MCRPAKSANGCILSQHSLPHDYIIVNKCTNIYGLEFIPFFCRNLETEDQAVQICKEKFQLSSLSKDRSVSPLQMNDRCERLSKEVNPDLNNSTLIVSKYYHVNEDGHISIPWNWK